MDQVIHALDALLASMRPVLHDGCYVFITDAAGAVPMADVIALVREPEGLSLVVHESTAQAHQLPAHFRASWITLTVHSALAAVGLTAAVSAALARAGIACNVVAGMHHDHLFVPASRASDAMATLRELQAAHNHPA